MSRFRVCESEWMPLNAEYAIDGVNEEEAICGRLITKVSAKKVGRTQDELKGVRASTLKGCCARLFQGPQDYGISHYRL